MISQFGVGLIANVAREIPTFKSNSMMRKQLAWLEAKLTRWLQEMQAAAPA
jgi:hypothetical protein